MRVGVLALISVVTTVAGVAFSASPGGADRLGDARAQASAIAAQLQESDQRLQALTDQYSAADYRLAQVEAEIAQSQHQVMVDRAAVDRNRAALRRQALIDYTSSGTSSPTADLFNSDPSGTGIRQEYSAIAAGSVSAVIARLRSSVDQLSGEQANLQLQRARASDSRATLVAAKSQATALVAQEEATKASADGAVQSLVAQQQAAASTAAAAAFTAKVNEARASTASTPPAPPSRGSTGSSAPPQTAGPPPAQSTTTPSGAPPPAVLSGAAGAIQAAEREIGVPYVWGGASPSQGFDCSGLIMWAYAQVGIGLPHYSGAQFADTAHIPISEIQPGDLLFYGPQGADHEAMYIGGGQMIEAPHTGASVRIVGVRTDSSTVVGRVR